MKLDFTEPKIGDIGEFNKVLSEVDSDSFSKSFGSYFLWAENHKTKICFNDDILYIKYDKESPIYEMPKGARTDEKLINSVELLLKHHADLQTSEKFKFTRLLKQEAAELQRLFPDQFEILSARDDFEYVYSVADLAELKGKKYHGKRGHIKKFSKNNTWEYFELNMKKKDEYTRFFKLWFKEKSDTNQNEMRAIEKALDYYGKLGLYGGIISVDDKIAACAIGERINNETFVVHFEKALSEFADTYTIINNELCRHLQSEYKFINREEDLGIPGLRKAKLSYYPQFFVEKYNAVVK